MGEIQTSRRLAGLIPREALPDASGEKISGP